MYSHILDDDRRKNAELFEEAFYEKKNLDPQMHVQQANNNATVADEVDPELLAKVLANPEMRALLNSLAKTMKQLVYLHHIYWNLHHLMMEWWRFSYKKGYRYFYWIKFTSQKRMDKPSRMRYIIYRQENILCFR